jgi:dTDP-4-amino-4,6-dideoxygalactose transaminase
MIPFNQPSFSGRETEYLLHSLASGHTSGNGPYTKRAQVLIEEIQGTGRALLTTSCTHALEMSARLMDLQPGDEVIVPDYTFVSTASAYLWNGAQPVFADIRPDTLNIDIESVKSRISARTRAICVVHYAGVAAQPDEFAELAAQHGLMLIEDNAHGFGASWKGKPLGTFGSLSTLSFHETKNVSCGEGGALVINDPALLERAEILREKGTDRSRFLRGQVDKYTWVDNGSSWVMSDLLAAILVGQLERFAEIQERRMAKWLRYSQRLQGWAELNDVLVPHIPEGAVHSAHMYNLRLPSESERDRLLKHLRDRAVLAVFHYQSLHSSPMGASLGESDRVLPTSSAATMTNVRLPLFESLSKEAQDAVIEAVLDFRVATGPTAIERRS